MRALSLVVLGVLVGCSEDPAGDPSTSNGPEEWAPALALGSGAAAFEPVADGDGILVWRGEQAGGGYHLNVGAEVTGMSPEVAVSPRVTVVSSGIALASDQQPAYMGLYGFDEADCTGEFWGVRAYLDDAEPAGDLAAFICALEGEAIELSVEVANLTTQEVVSDSVELVVALHETALAHCR